MEKEPWRYLRGRNKIRASTPETKGRRCCESISLMLSLFFANRCSMLVVILLMWRKQSALHLEGLHDASSPSTELKVIIIFRSSKVRGASSESTPSESSGEHAEVKSTPAGEGEAALAQRAGFPLLTAKALNPSHMSHLVCSGDVIKTRWGRSEDNSNCYRWSSFRW